LQKDITELEAAGLTVVRCFPGSFKEVWAQEQSGPNSASPADQMAWTDYNIAVRTGENDFAALQFPTKGAYAQAKIIDPAIAELTSVLLPDGTVCCWFWLRNIDPYNCNIASLNARLIAQGWLAPAPPSAVGDNSCRYILKKDPLIKEYTPDTTDAPHLRIKPFATSAIPLHGYMAFAPPDEPEFIESGILDAGGRVIMAGVPKVGKSRLALNMAFSLATGQKFLGFETSSLPRTLFIQFEVSEKRFRQRVNSIARAWRISPDNDLPFYLTTLPSLKMDSRDGLVEFRRMLQVFKAQVVFLDPMVKLHTGDESDVQDMQKLLDALDDIIDDLGVSIVIVHHFKKSAEQEGWARIRGSSYIPAWADTMLLMDKQKELVKIKGVLRNGEDFTKVVRFEDNHTITVIGDEEELVRQVILKVLTDNPATSRKDLVARVGRETNVEQQMIYTVMQELADGGAMMP